MGEDPIARWDVPVECLGELLLLGELNDQQTSVKAVPIQVADAVIASLVDDPVQQLGQPRVAVVLIAAWHAHREP